jgi:hypothetical protein
VTEINSQPALDKMEHEKMLKSFNLKIFLFLIVSCIVLVSIFPCSFAVADQPSVEAKTLQLLGAVADIDMAVYSQNLKPLQTDTYLTLDKQTSDLTLTSKDSSLRVRCSFVGDRLQMLRISHSAGEISLNSKASSTVDDAKAFLTRYQAYSNDRLFGNLQSMLNDVHVNQNASKSLGNLKLDVRVDLMHTEFFWTYVDASGVTAPVKNVALTYEYGTLKSFVDNWQFYTVAGSPKISNDQAVNLALEAAAAFSYTSQLNDNVTVYGFKVASVGNASLCYLNYQEVDLARDCDPFTLYPSWFVPIGFDRVYPGGVSGVYVRLWGDTGEIKEVVPMVIGQEADSSGVSGASSEEPIIVEQSPVESNAGLQVVFADSMLVPLVLIVGSCILVFFLRSRLAGLVGIARLPKWRFKPLTALLCTLMLSSLFLVFVPPAEAYLPGQSAGSLVFGSRYQQFNDWSDGTYFDEPGAVVEVTNAVFDYFNSTQDYAGKVKKELDVSEEYDSDVPSVEFKKSDMLDDIVYMRNNYDTFCALYIGHMAGPGNYLFNGTDDGPTNDVRWEDISDLDTFGKTFFAWSWTCNSVTTMYDGLAYGWFGSRLYASSSACYIGFTGGSPALSAKSFSTTDGLGKNFIMSFYEHALQDNDTVFDSLDEASWDVFEVSYYSSPLYNGYSTYWPVHTEGLDNTPGWFPGSMQILGNPGVYLISHLQESLSPPPSPRPSVHIYAGGYVSEFGQNWFINVPFNFGGYDFYCYDGVEIYNNNLPWGVYWFNLPDSVEVFDTTMYLIGVAGHNYTEVPFIIDCSSSTVVLNAEYGFQLNVTSTAGGSTDLPGVSRYVGGNDQFVNVTATADSGYSLDYWLLNGEFAGANPTLTVPLVNSYDVQAVFCPVGYETRYSLTVAGVHWFWGTPVDDAVYIDGQYVGQTNNEFFVCPGTHLVSVATDSELIFRFEYIDNQNWFITDNIDETNSPMTLTVRYYYG